jgi:hypothetical protein
MKKLYSSLSEKDRRRYAAVEAKKLGYGGISYICSLFLCDDKTVKKGMREPTRPKLREIFAADFAVSLRLIAAFIAVVPVLILHT